MTYEYDLNPNIYSKSCCSNILKQYDSSENKYNPSKHIKNNFIEKLKQRIEKQQTKISNVSSSIYLELDGKNTSYNSIH